jgi:ribose transport system substrate-binding protein
MVSAGSNAWRAEARGQWAPITGLGPHGEFPASVEQLKITDENAAEARRRGFTVAIVLHTTRSDWSRLQMAGIRTTLETFNATVLEVVDCDFEVRRQIDALEALVERGPDAIISIPVSNTLTADAHRRVTDSGIRLVLMDNAPVGMVTGEDCVSVVSADNFGNGVVAAEILSNHVPEGGCVGVVGFKVDFFVTNERELAFRKTIKERRPDVTLRHAAFSEVDEAAAVALDLVGSGQPVDGLFVVWDEPAIRVAEALRSTGRTTPTTTIDLGIDAAVEIAAGGLIKGVGAQQPYDQGMAEALVAIMALVGDEPPPWVALAGLSVTRDNVIEAYETVWHAPAPPPLRRAYESARPASGSHIAAPGSRAMRYL